MEEKLEIYQVNHIVNLIEKYNYTNLYDLFNCREIGSEYQDLIINHYDFFSKLLKGKFEDLLLEKIGDIYAVIKEHLECT